MKQVTVFVLALLALLSACPAFADAPPTQWESQMLDQAATCAPVGPKTHKMLLKMLRAEEEAGIPDHVRGITVAVACIEAKFNPKAEGDHKFSKDGKTPMAVGLFQMWPWWKSHVKDRSDPDKATKAWLAVLKDEADSAKRKCKTKDDHKAWKAAVAYIQFGPGATKRRCGQTTRHYALMQTWRGVIEDAGNHNDHEGDAALEVSVK